MSIEYIRKFYSVDFKIGDEVQIRPGAGSLVDGCIGTLIRARNARLVVKGSSWKGDFHPSDVQRPAAHQATKEPQR